MSSVTNIKSICDLKKCCLDFQRMGRAYGAMDCMQSLKAHRLASGAKVLRAIQALPQGSMTDWLRLVHGDVPEVFGQWRCGC